MSVNLNVDAETLAIIQKVLKQLAKKFTFDSYEEEDMYQEGFFIACKALPGYDPSKGTSLSTFLYQVLSTRYVNFIRDHSVRSNNHCINHSVYNDECAACKGRQETQDQKRLVQQPKGIEGVEFPTQSQELHEIDIKELERRINSKLPKDMREDYLLMKEGSYVSRSRRLEIENFILGIINE